MKTVLLSLAALLTIGTAKAQFTMDFEANETVLTGNCWQMVNVHHTTNPAEVITGTGSLYTNPPTNGNDTRDLVTPTLNVTNSSFSVSFNYRLNSTLSGNATRSIEVGVLKANGSYTILSTIVMDRFTPTTVQNFSGIFELGTTGNMRLVIKMGGSNGNGNVRIIFDDLYVNASPRYANGSCNNAPIAVNDVFSGVIGNIVTGNVMTNDIEPNGETMTASSVLLSPQGILIMNPNGSFIFTPFLLFTGPTTSFTYQLSDNGMDPMTSNVATVTLNYSAGGALPVTLVSFNAMLGNNNLVNLTWTTASEQNVSHFVIEKSIDGQNYSDAALVFATGNSTEKVNYAHTDALGTSFAKVIYYRLRSVDVDGKSQLSEARIIRTTKATGSNISILTYPNPVTSELRITIPANWQNKKVTFEIYSLNGSLTSKKENANSSQTETINVSKAAPGVYMVRVSCEGEIAQQKIVKQ
jgi:hypothetical protein